MAKNNDEAVAQKRLPLGLLASGSTLLVVLIWFGLGIFAAIQDDPAEFGDMFGAASSLFSGLAFAGIILTIWIQAREFELQRLELRETRRALEGQERQLAEQVAELQRQAVNDNFFRMLAIYRDMANTIRHPGRGEVGIDYWRHLAKTYHQNEAITKSIETGDSDLCELASQAIYDAFEPSLGPYFATLAEMLSFIAAQDPQTQTRLSHILRAQIPPQEQVALFFHGLTAWGHVYLKGHIEKMKLFHYYSRDAAYPERRIRHWYAAATFNA